MSPVEQPRITAVMDDELKKRENDCIALRA